MVSLTCNGKSTNILLNYPNDSLALLHHRIEYGGMIVFIVHTTIKVYDRSMHLLLLYVSKRKGV